MSLLRPIHHTFAPLGDLNQCLRSIGLLVQPWKWKRGPAPQSLKNALKHFFGADAFLYGSGREGLHALLRAMHLRAGEEVIVQGYTCAVVANAIHAAGGVPVYSDITLETLSFDMSAIERSITKHTRAIICQHTFGIPADGETLRALCDRHTLFLIEDCAHVIPDRVGPAGIGHYGDFVLLSFGRDKAISGVAGGAILSRNPSVTQNLKTQEHSLIDYSLWTIFRYLLYPLLYRFARPFYGLWLGKAFLAIAGKTRILLPILEPDEKKGSMSPLLHSIPNACATLALAQWNKRTTINDHRRMLTGFYLTHFVGAYRDTPLQIKNQQSKIYLWPSAITSDLPLQKFPIFIENTQEMRKRLKRENIHLDDGWTGCVICPESVELDALHYEWGKDPVAEGLCQQILNLPTHPGMSLKDGQRLVKVLDTLISKSEIRDLKSETNLNTEA